MARVKAQAEAAGKCVGIVKYWNDSKGFGFVTPADGGDDLFTHMSGLEDGTALNEGKPVMFTPQMDPRRGQMRASGITGAYFLGSSSAPAAAGGGGGGGVAATLNAIDSAVAGGGPAGATVRCRGVPYRSTPGDLMLFFYGEL